MAQQVCCRSWKRSPQPVCVPERTTNKQADTETMFCELELGRKVKRPENLTRNKIKERLYNIVKNYKSRREAHEIAEYLEAIGHNIQLKLRGNLNLNFLNNVILSNFQQ